MDETALSLKLHAVMLGVRDVDVAASFYAEKLGFTLGGRFGEFAFVDAGGTMLVLSGDLARARPRAGPEPVEVVLAVDAVGEAYRRLRARGVTFQNEPHPIDGVNHVANFEDPDGHRFSLYGPP